MKYLFFLWCSFLSIVAVAQTHKKTAPQFKDVDFVTSKLTDSLKRNNTDYIIVVSRVIQGMQLADSIGFPSYRYICWQKDSLMYFQEIRGYNDHETVKNKLQLIRKSEIFSFLNNNYDSIKGDEILPFITKNISNNSESYEVVRGVHRGFNSISILIPDGGIQKEFEDADLLDDYGPSMINLNSTHNKNSKIKILWDLLWAVITTKQ